MNTDIIIRSMKFVVCTRSLYLPISIATPVRFEVGKKYSYEPHKFSLMCDEQPMHIVDGVVLHHEHFKKHFTSQADWRDQQIKKIL